MAKKSSPKKTASKKVAVKTVTAKPATEKKVTVKPATEKKVTAKPSADTKLLQSHEAIILAKKEVNTDFNKCWDLVGRSTESGLVEHLLATKLHEGLINVNDLP